MSPQHVLSYLILLVIILLVGLILASVARAGDYYDDYQPYDLYGYHEPTRIIGPVDSPPMTIIPWSHGCGYYRR